VTTESGKTYEMLWDCRYCGTKKLLGKTHRQGPECGGEQHATLERGCTPRTKTQTRMSDQCRYEAEEWRVAHTETAQGTTNQGARLWPTVNLTRPGNCVGCERLGRREEKLLVRVRDKGGSEQICSVSESLFGRVKLSDTLPMKRTVIGKLLECTSLGQ
jgi:hypothetical protein